MAALGYEPTIADPTESPRCRAAVTAVPSAPVWRAKRGRFHPASRCWQKKIEASRHRLTIKALPQQVAKWPVTNILSRAGRTTMPSPELGETPVRAAMSTWCVITAQHAGARPSLKGRPALSCCSARLLWIDRRRRKRMPAA